MKSLWPEGFDDVELRPVKTLLQEQVKVLRKMTSDMVYASVLPLSLDEMVSKSLDGMFAFRFDIRSRILDKYRFHLFSFSHEITLYPVKFILDEKVADELKLSRGVMGRTTAVISSMEDVEEFISEIFHTKQVRLLVSSIVAMSK